MKYVSKTVNITIPEPLLKQIDLLAKRDFTSRSDVVRQALLDKLRRAPQDEWESGVQETWKPIVDFRAIDEKGVDADSVLAAIESLDTES